MAQTLMFAASRLISTLFVSPHDNRALSSLRYEFDAPVSELFQPFIAIASETDDLPIGQVRREWNTSALAIKDIQIARYENEKRPLALKACEDLIYRLQISQF